MEKWWRQYRHKTIKSRKYYNKITSLTFLPEDGHSHGGGAGGGGGTEGYVSSLFNHNPEIPRLELTSAAPKKEDVFSLRTFSDTGVHPYLSKALLEQGMETLTLVQSKAIPVVLSGKDALIKSQTGSGKTLAYAVPIIHRLQVWVPTHFWFIWKWMLLVKSRCLLEVRGGVLILRTQPSR